MPEREKQILPHIKKKNALLAHLIEDHLMPEPTPATNIGNALQVQHDHLHRINDKIGTRHEHVLFPNRKKRNRNK